jgi:hypothetical protein
MLVSRRYRGPAMSQVHRLRRPVLDVRKVLVKRLPGGQQTY